MPDPLTKADLRRAVIRTAALAHWRHDRTGGRAIAAGVQDNDGWASAATRAAMIAFARQQAAMPFNISFSNPFGAPALPCAAAPDVTQPSGPNSPLRRAPVGTAGLAASRSCPLGPAVPALSLHSFHNGEISHA